MVELFCLSTAQLVKPTRHRQLFPLHPQAGLPHIILSLKVHTSSLQRAMLPVEEIRSHIALWRLFYIVVYNTTVFIILFFFKLCNIITFTITSREPVSQCIH